MGNGGTASLILKLDIRWGEWSHTFPDLFISGKETRYPLSRKLDGPQNWAGRFKKPPPPPEKTGNVRMT
jgi:hypothetical protein